MSESIARVVGPLGLCLLGVLGMTECGAPVRDFGPGMSTAGAFGVAGSVVSSEGGAAGKMTSAGGNAGSSQAGATQGGSEAGAAGDSCADGSCASAGNGGGGSGSGGSGGTGGSAGAGCADTTSDAKNCGACGHDCTSSPSLAPGAQGITCHAGQCVIPDSACLPGKKHCSTDASDVCETDVTTAARCGDCNTKCDGTQVCSSGKCVSTCPGTQTSCASGQSTGCYDLSTSVGHCTSCTNACPSPAANGSASCQNGCKVNCNPSFHQCGTKAECESDTDTNNCGPNCVTCTTTDPNATPKCSSNACSYPCNPGFYSCGGACVANNDQNHCGTCGNACSTSQTCVSGACLVKDGSDCNVPSDCKSGVCTTYYQDLDGDKQGSAAAPKRVCGSTPPAGYVTNSDDCCDIVGGDGVNIYKNNPNWYTKSTTSCSKGWDYDCSGNIEMEVTHIDSDCKQNPVGQCTGFTEWSGAAAPLACGASGSMNSCLAIPVAGTCATSMPGPHTQGCH